MFQNCKFKRNWVVAFHEEMQKVLMNVSKQMNMLEMLCSTFMKKDEESLYINESV